MSQEKFISEPIEPKAASFDAGRMATGEPGVPAEFVWRGRTIKIIDVLKTWRKTGPCTHGSGEMYVRRHYYEVQTAGEGTMTIYCDRKPRGKRRWWLFSIKITD